MEEIEVESDLRRDMGVTGFWDPYRMCVLDFIFVDTDAESYKGKHPHRILSQHKQHKSGKHIEA